MAGQYKPHRGEGHIDFRFYQKYPNTAGAPCRAFWSDIPLIDCRPLDPRTVHDWREENVLNYEGLLKQDQSRTVLNWKYEELQRPNRKYNGIPDEKYSLNWDFEELQRLKEYSAINNIDKNQEALFNWNYEDVHGEILNGETAPKQEVWRALQEEYKDENDKIGLDGIRGACCSACWHDHYTRGCCGTNVSHSFIESPF